ncbi:MAG: membrane protein insertase YidC [Pseudomonadota bacterium]|nr:membrane protein insertase YidC [Pseudomonadota bacterium]
MEQRNLILAIVLSVTILLGFQFLIETPRIERERTQQASEAAKTPQTDAIVPASPTSPAAPANSIPSGSVNIPGSPGMSTAAPVAAGPSRAQIMGAFKRIKIATPRLRGSVTLRGARLDDLVLADYRETVDDDSDNITLLSPPGAPNPYYAQFGWVAIDHNVKVPGPDTVWSANHARLTARNPVTLTWDNGQGQVFTQVISIDQNFMFTVGQSVRNSGATAVAVRPYGLISRTGTPEISGFFILHEGLLGVFNETLAEVDYDDLQEDGKVEQNSTGGWIGITDKFWLTALIPDQKTTTDSRFLHGKQGEMDKYQVDFLGPTQSIAPGSSATASNKLFAGAKEVRLLDGYREDLGIVRFDLAVDWGWLWFLTKPIFQALIYFNNFIGNFGLAIMFLTVLIKLAFFPLANKSYRAMSRMKKLQPLMTEIREQYGDDKQRQQQEMMALYKRENANPMAGCFPILIQIPVFFALYKVLFVTIEMRHAPFFGWIQDLSAPDPLALLTVFGLVQWDVPEILEIVNIGIWPIIMGLTMFLQQKLNPQPADATQAKIFMMLPIVFTFLLGRFPAGLVIYWAWNNLLSITQQWVIMRRMGVSASGGTIAAAAPKTSGAKVSGRDMGSANAPPGGKRKAKARAAAAEASGGKRKGKGKRSGKKPAGKSRKKN